VQFGSFGLPVVAGLVARAADEATRTDEQVGLPLRDHLVREWAKPVYAPATNLDGPIHQQAVSPEALAYLDSVAKVLRKNEGHAVLPEGEKLAGSWSRWEA
jgi:hypothetical protein